MKIAANQVEQILLAASAEVGERYHETDKSHSSDYEGLVAAFKRAAELRGRPLTIVALRGRKSRQTQDVIVTNLTRDDGKGLFAFCLVPYTQVQLDSHRKNMTYRTERTGKKLLDFGRPACYHEQWIRVSRLQEDGYQR